MSKKSDKYVQYYEALLSNFANHLTAKEIQKAKEKASESLDYLTSGYDFDINSLTENAFYEFEFEENSTKRTQEICIKDIKFISLCKHHLLPFFGSCEIIYSPNQRIIGFSRVTKIVKILSLRMQLQENLTREIADILIKILNPKSLTVKISATHTCMMIKDSKNNSEILTIENYSS
jgi:GTP cyclohydrolase I